ncbi:flavin reductase [Micromonospora sp. DT4]|uniref:flavin reductase n=1 Tax=Micromonospora sp. DT4 TaxID=3393438 RepID=UPI003CF68AC8
MMAEPTTIREAWAATLTRGRRAAAALDRRLDGQHTPRRPQWDCHTCGQAWPCAPARVRLAEAYGRDRIGLSMYCGSLHPVASEELPTAAPGELWERFVGWTR